VGALHLIVAIALGAPSAEEELIWQIEAHRLPVSALVPSFTHPDPAIRVRATEAAGRLRASAAELAGPSAGSHPAVREAAAFALGSSADGLVLVRARLQLETDPAVRAALLVALGRVGDATDAPLLIEALSGPHALAATTALGRMGVRKVAGVGSPAVAAALADVVARFPLAIKGPDGGAAFFDESRRRAAWALSRMALVSPPPELVARIRKLALENGDSRARAWLVRSVGELAGAEDFLLAASNDDAPEVRLAALRALGKVGCVNGLLPPRLADPDAGVRVEALKAAATCADVPDAALVASLARATAAERAAALTSLSKRDRLPSPREEFQKESYPLAVRVAAVESMTSRPRLLRVALHHSDARLRSAAAGVLLDEASGPRPNEVSELLGASDTLIAGAAAEAAALRPDPSFERPLLGILKRKGASRPTTVAAVRALDALYLTGRLPRANPAAREALKRWLWLPELTDAAARLAVTVGADPPRRRHPARALPSLADVRRIRSARVLTSEGELRIRLLPDVAPLTVWNFAALAESGFFTGLTFHRVVSDFVIQTGDPRGDGWGGSEGVIPDELSPESYTAGTVGMALSGPDTGSSQWFITTSPQPHLDFGYTVFGRLVSDLRVARAIDTEDFIRSVTIERVAPGSP
jgi:cyclophilin family peptidyl-prolyl cis-trans isomerase